MYFYTRLMLALDFVISIRTQEKYSEEILPVILAAGGKPSTRFPPGRLVELIGMTKSKASIKRV